MKDLFRHEAEVGGLSIRITKHDDTPGEGWLSTTRDGLDTSTLTSEEFGMLSTACLIAADNLRTS